MKKRNRIIYWIASIWLALGMTSTGIVQLIRNDEEIAVFEELGYPAYLMSILGVWKILGVVAILIPGFPLVKEWAYAGFFFVMSGAAVSHLAAGHGFAELFGPLLLILLTITSWYFRPESRKMPAGN
ncbi:MAG: DoxX family protein [Solitalea sp.]